MAIHMAEGYPSMEFIDFLKTEKINYLFCLFFNDYKFERKNIATILSSGKKFYVLKNKMKFESVTGKTTIYVD